MTDTNPVAEVLTAGEIRLAAVFKEVLDANKDVMAATLMVVDIAHADLLAGNADQAMARLGEILSAPQFAGLLAHAAILRARASSAVN